MSERLAAIPGRKTQEGQREWPMLREWLQSLPTEPDPEASLQRLNLVLRINPHISQLDMATATAHFLHHVIEKSQWPDVHALLAKIQRLGGKLMLAKTPELVIGNIVQRVLGLIRTEYATIMKDASSTDTPTETRPSNPPRLRPITTDPSALGASIPGNQSHLLSESTLPYQARLQPLSHASGTSTPEQRSLSQGQLNDLRAEILDGIQEIIQEIESEGYQISRQADSQIRQGDIVVCSYPTNTLREFLKGQARKMTGAAKFTVRILNDGGVGYESGADAAQTKLMKQKLEALGIVVQIINGAPGAWMSGANFVILEANAITCSGAAVTHAAGPTIACAALEANVPVFVLAGIYKFSPDVPLNYHQVMEMGSNPGFSDATFDGCGVGLVAATQVIRPRYITKYISNIGCHDGSGLEKIISEHYHSEDKGLYAKLLDEEKRIQAEVK